MITALIRVEHGVEALAVTLAALVPAVVDGLVGEAVVLTSRIDEPLAGVADAVGATLLPVSGDPWREGARRAKRDWLLCLADGDVPTEGWIRAIDRFIALSPPDRRFGRLARPGASWGARAAALVRRPAVVPGDLVHRSVLLGTPARLPRPARISASVERDPVFG
jgi:hypothetical protein